MVRLVPLTLSIFAASIVSLAAADAHQRAGPSASPAQRKQLRNTDGYANSLRELDEIIRKSPGLWQAYDARANLFIQRRNWPAALQDLNSTIRLEPAFFEASWKRSLVYLRLHNYAASLKDLDALAKVTFQTQNPGELALTLSQRAWIRASCPDGSFRDGQRSLQDAQKACTLSKWENDDYVDTLAAAYAERGDFDSAVRYEEQAIALKNSEHSRDVQEIAEFKQKHHDQQDQREADDFAARLAKEDKTVIEGYAKRLALYKQRRPYHGPL